MVDSLRLNKWLDQRIMELTCWLSDESSQQAYGKIEGFQEVKKWVEQEDRVGVIIRAIGGKVRDVDELFGRCCINGATPEEVRRLVAEYSEDHSKDEMIAGVIFAFIHL